MSGHRLTVRAESLVPLDCQVLIDDVDISHSLTGLEIRLGPYQSTTATIGLLVDHIDVDAKTCSLLQAYVKDQERHE